MATVIVPITDFVRKFGDYTALLAKVNEITLTRDGRPFATLKSTPEEKNKKLLEVLKTESLWKGTELDSDVFWAKALRRNSRKHPITL